MYEQAIKLLLEEIDKLEMDMDYVLVLLEESPLNAVNINIYNDHFARRKEMLEAVEVLQGMESVIKQKQFKEYARTLLKECGL